MLAACVGCANPAARPGASRHASCGGECCPRHPAYALGPPDACRAGYHATVWQELAPGYHEIYEGPYGEPAPADYGYEQLPAGIAVPDEPRSDEPRHPPDVPPGMDESSYDGLQGTIPPPDFPVEDASYDPFDEQDQ